MNARLTSMNRKVALLLFIWLISYSVLLSQTEKKDSTIRQAASSKVEWYKKISIRGYAQLRYNKLLETNPDLMCEQCDRSWGGDAGGFFFRRIRLIFFGQVHERVYVYIQPDFASSPDNKTLNFAQIRDAYIDVGLDKENTFRIRFGQSKVPYGFENLQSSQNRLPLDRADALNSAVSNERDIGAFLYWAPKEIRERFSYLVSSGLKGSGDYGVVGFGIHNGQTPNRADANDKQHVVARVSYPFLIKGKQFIEPGIQGYTGKYVVQSLSATPPTGKQNFEYLDQRIAATLVIYPQPFGLTAEYNWGTGPEYNPVTNAIEQHKLSGGYAMASYKWDLKDQVVIPFTRYQYYDGGKKHERDARRHGVRELEVGVEWQPFKALEFVAMYTISERTFEDATIPDNSQNGRLLRLQVQVNL